MGPQVLRDFLDPKDRLAAWACQEPPEKKVCLASPALRESPAYLERREQKERKDRRAYLASGFQEGLATRETKAWRASREALERRERRGARGSRGCPVLRAPRAHLGV